MENTKRQLHKEVGDLEEAKLKQENCKTPQFMNIVALLNASNGLHPTIRTRNGPQHGSGSSNASVS